MQELPAVDFDGAFVDNLVKLAIQALHEKIQYQVVTGEGLRYKPHLGNESYTEIAGRVALENFPPTPVMQRSISPAVVGGALTRLLGPRRSVTSADLNSADAVFIVHQSVENFSGPHLQMSRVEDLGSGPRAQGLYQQLNPEGAKTLFDGAQMISLVDNLVVWKGGVQSVFPRGEEYIHHVDLFSPNIGNQKMPPLSHLIKMTGIDLRGHPITRIVEMVADASRRAGRS